MRLRAICKGTVAFNDGHVGEPTPCPWVIQGSRSDVNSNWFIKTYNHEHKCLQTRKVRSATTKFISKQIMDQIESNPTIPVRALQEQLQKDYQVGFSIHKVFRAKSTAKKLVQGDYKKQYDVLRDYILELQSTNPETTMKLEFDSEPNLSATSRRFKRMYVCLGGMKKGFRACLRDFLGFDGAFMKGPFPGQILTAVGVDYNNGIYPLAYAIVETENTDSWKWFLECIADDLDLYANSNFTFISDRQKGLQIAISQLFPCAEHRFCLRHIHDNMRKTWRTNEYKENLWNRATATTVPEFNHRMQQFSSYDVEAYNWLKKIPPQHWARSHFTGRAVSDMLLNNLCEVFNSKLIEERDKPLITCLECIREYMMKRICNVIKVQKKCVGPLTPSAIKIMEKNVNWASQYTVRWNGSDKYQVQGPWQDQHVVDMVERGALARNMESSLCVQGRAMWPISECPIKITPPLHKNQPGRPKKKRRQSAEEKSQKKGDNVASGSGSQSNIASGSGKLTRKFIQVTCSKCKIKGHNARTCKGQGGAIAARRCKSTSGLPEGDNAENGVLPPVLLLLLHPTIYKGTNPRERDRRREMEGKGEKCHGCLSAQVEVVVLGFDVLISSLLGWVKYQVVRRRCSHNFPRTDTSSPGGWVVGRDASPGRRTQPEVGGCVGHLLMLGFCAHFIWNMHLLTLFDLMYGLD
ncbi:unnamed protein product [Lactuca saligna]|uniref:MULE transposase domain-containing protein n=1 Tax=Lactuca saligna TaxID=75948 RepID=A0AA36EGE9_LACSI|nr:unnamed protein product [Lactuca saligna]